MRDASRMRARGALMAARAAMFTPRIDGAAFCASADVA